MARPGPRPSGRNNEIKVMLDDEEWADVQVFMAIHGIDSRSEGVRQIIRRLCRGVIGSMPKVFSETKPEPAICRSKIREENTHGNCSGVGS